MVEPKTQIDDLQTGTNLKRIDDLESFRKEFEGTEFYSKILKAIQESRSIEEEIKRISWKRIREKIIWLILGASSLILIDFIIRAIPHLLSFFK